LILRGLFWCFGAGFFFGRRGDKRTTPISIHTGVSADAAELFNDAGAIHSKKHFIYQYIMKVY